MLRGAVTFGEDFEENYMKRIFNLNKGMTQAISHFSRYEDASVHNYNTIREYSGKRYLIAEGKIANFYNYVSISLAILSATIFIADNSKIIDI